MPQANLTNDIVTIDSVLNEFKQWRKNKGTGANRAIPDSLWMNIFKLEELSHEGSDLRRIFSLNSQQYNKKHEQLINSSNTPELSFEPFVAVEVSNKIEHKITPKQTKLKEVKSEISQIKSTKKVSEDFSAIKTIIVELVRPDGYKLKIHTTNDSVDLIISTFMNQEFNS